MKLLALLLFTLSATAQEQKVFHLSKNDVAIMSLEVLSGYAKGWADEVEYKHYELSQRFPGLFRNGNHFWDGRYDDDGIFDAKHLLMTVVIGTQVVGIIIKVGDLKKYKGWKLAGKIACDALKYYGSYHAGFFLSYNVTHGNKLFR